MTANKETDLIRDLAMMVRRLSAALLIADKDFKYTKLRKQANGLLERNGLQGNILRLQNDDQTEE